MTSSSPIWLVTGVAGFIAARTAEMLLERGDQVVGVDNLNDYYDVRLKEHRLQRLQQKSGFTFVGGDIEKQTDIAGLFERYEFAAVINLAARAGVRYSLENPFIYLSTNGLGTLNLLELMRQQRVPKMVLASTSSLYAGQPMPFHEDLAVNTPISPYAASKKSAELYCHTYSHIYGLSILCMRLFTVVGPRQRPDLALHRFTDLIMENMPLVIYGDGTTSRDYTSVFDIIDGIAVGLKYIEDKNPLFEVFNLGNSIPVSIKDLVGLIAANLDRTPNIVYEKLPKGDVLRTCADISKAKSLLRYEPKVSLDFEVKRFIEWFKGIKK